MTATEAGPDTDRRVHLRTCPLCEAKCGLEIQVVGDRVERIRADRDEGWSKSHLCPKGTTLGHLHHDPDRLRHPMVREGDTCREVTWDEAFRRCSELLALVVAEHGIKAVTAYVGNPLARNLSLGRYIGILIGMSGIPMIYSAGTVDQWPKNVTSHLMYGGMWRIPVPDIRRTDLLVVMGANPHASQGSLLACPDVMGEIDGIRSPGRQGRRHRPPPLRRRAALRSRRRRRGRGGVRGRAGRGARRAHRRHRPRCGLAAPRLGPRPPGRPPVGGPRARRHQQQRAVSRHFRRTSSRATPPSTASR